MTQDPFVQIRNGDQPALFLPGWATDFRIFGEYDWPFDGAFLRSFDRYDKALAKEKLYALSKSGPVTLIGLSLGGFFAASLALECLNCVDRVILFGVQERYETEAIEESRERVKDDLNRFLTAFYRASIVSDEEFEVFKTTLLEDYLTAFSEDMLLEGLDLLEKQYLDPERLSAIKHLEIHHGTRDQIVPFKAGKRLSNATPHAFFHPLKGLGHIPFFHSGFKDKVQVF